MSREAASAFLAELEADEELRGQVLALQEHPAGGVRLSTQMLADRAARSGYSFSAQELYEAIEHRAAQASPELRDTELDAVTGGSKNEVAIETLEIVHVGLGDSAGVPAVQTVCLAPGRPRRAPRRRAGRMDPPKTTPARGMPVLGRQAAIPR